MAFGLLPEKLENFVDIGEGKVILGSLLSGRKNSGLYNKCNTFSLSKFRMLSV